jgi:hypothetical protein
MIAQSWVLNLWHRLVKWDKWVWQNNSPRHRHMLTLHPLHNIILVCSSIYFYAIARSEGGSINYHLICMGPIIRNYGVRAYATFTYLHRNQIRETTRVVFSRLVSRSRLYDMYIYMSGRHNVFVCEPIKKKSFFCWLHAVILSVEIKHLSGLVN